MEYLQLRILILSSHSEAVNRPSNAQRTRKEGGRHPSHLRHPTTQPTRKQSTRNRKRNRSVQRHGGFNRSKQLPPHVGAARVTDHRRQSWNNHCCPKSNQQEAATEVVVVRSRSQLRRGQKGATKTEKR
tara:strand:+ start:155 stop:541 length:387 start_codon:yes stop_codon:yes gene_type:complete